MAWFFLRVPGCGTRSAVESFKKEIERFGKVYEYDLGTETKPSAGWYTVKATMARAKSVRECLRDLGISEHIDQIEPLQHPTEGRALSKQRGLF